MHQDTHESMTMSRAMPANVPANNAVLTAAYKRFNISRGRRVGTSIIILQSEFQTAFSILFKSSATQIDGQRPKQKLLR
jgi:hypothetical protein